DYQVLVTDLANGQTEEVRERHRLRYLFAPELKRCLRTAGFETMQLNEWISGAEPSDKTWNIMVVGRAAAGRA
ncbi:MAG TPA: hypothetical protein VI566_04135, partial [Xanthomonadales bacterium]|nr:hypothetical protein [Xanthomonadales bacterium]